MSSETFPAAGHTYQAHFGDLAFHLNFDVDGKTMRCAPAAAPDFDRAEAVTYGATAIRPNVFLVTWKKADQTTVTHVEDFEKGVVHSNITLPGNIFLSLTGTWTRVV